MAKGETASFPMDEAACLEWLDLNPQDAEDLLIEADPKLVAAFRRVDKALVDYLAKVRVFFPDAEYYTASGGFNLMLGKSHTSDHRQRGQQQLVALLGRARIGDGDF
jgi:hypothetical protein